MAETQPGTWLTTARPSPNSALNDCRPKRSMNAGIVHHGALDVVTVTRATSLIPDGYTVWTRYMYFVEACTLLDPNPRPLQ